MIEYLGFDIEDLEQLKKKKFEKNNAQDVIKKCG